MKRRGPPVPSVSRSLFTALNSEVSGRCSTEPRCLVEQSILHGALRQPEVGCDLGQSASISVRGDEVGDNIRIDTACTERDIASSHMLHLMNRRDAMFAQSGMQSARDRRNTTCRSAKERRALRSPAATDRKSHARPHDLRREGARPMSAQGTTGGVETTSSR